MTEVASTSGLTTVAQDDEKPSMESTPLIADTQTAGVTAGGRRKRFNLGNYTSTKTSSNGLTDFALLTRNCTLIQELLLGQRLQFINFLLTLAVLSIILQIFSGVIMLVVLRMNVENEDGKVAALKWSRRAALLAFFIAVVNVIIAAFE
ncbi:ninjurin-2-like [Ptychodera flava]|uniref:ninjurin-2-like n=1 Tax=Ptychodera flava TaxID=63121 RepID=UPI00396A0585